MKRKRCAAKLEWVNGKLWLSSCDCLNCEDSGSPMNAVLVLAAILCAMLYGINLHC